MAEGKFALGLDFGTNSVRAVVVDISSGEEVGSYVHNYRQGEDGIITDEKNPNVARQDPEDYVEGLEASVRGALGEAKKKNGFQPENIIGIGVDTTGSTPIPVDEEGQPLSFQEEFKGNKNAMGWLWKDHSSHNEAEEISEEARKSHPEYLTKCGGTYSSEWFFSKILHCLRTDPKVFESAVSWVELADYVPGLLTGNQRPKALKRSVCAAGHKAMYNEKWGGLPDKEFLARFDPKLGELRERLYSKAYAANVRAGSLSRDMAEKLGLSEGIAVAVGAFDAHMGAVGAGIKPGTLVKIIGTSTCDMMVVPDKEDLPDIPGLCGIVDGSILPGCFGLEAGQSAVGDIFNWFVNKLVPSDYLEEARKKKIDIHQLLTEKASSLKAGESGLLALDWNNGNRTILVDARLTGLLLGQTLQTSPEEIYRTLIEATAYGAKVIINRFEEYGIRVKEVINCGGIAERNSFLMQVYADIIGRPMKISGSPQTCALGAAMFGAVAAGRANGGYERTEEAQAAMSFLKETVYSPIKENQEIYQKLFTLYQELHDVFGTKKLSRNLAHVMKDLLKIRDEVRGE